ncbi:fimbrial protein [Buttiauxella agrestis]
MNKLRVIYWLNLLWLIFIFPHLVLADSDVQFHGSLVVVQCQVNQDQNVNVQFNNIGVKKVDGVNFETAIPFTISCNNQGGEDNPALTLSIKGTVSDFDDNAIATNVDGLAIKIKKNGEDLDFNTDTEITYAPQPTLTAVPVKREGANLTGGTFHATATLVVNVA